MFVFSNLFIYLLDSSTHLCIDLSICCLVIYLSIYLFLFIYYLLSIFVLLNINFAYRFSIYTLMTLMYPCTYMIHCHVSFM